MFSEVIEEGMVYNTPFVSLCAARELLRCAIITDLLIINKLVMLLSEVQCPNSELIFAASRPPKLGRIAKFEGCSR